MAQRGTEILQWLFVDDFMNDKMIKHYHKASSTCMMLNIRYDLVLEAQLLTGRPGNTRLWRLKIDPQEMLLSQSRG